jgi:hypothetical protein
MYRVWGRGEVHTVFSCGNVRKESTWKTKTGNVNMDLKKVRCRGVDWIELAQDRTGGGYLLMR